MRIWLTVGFAAIYAPVWAAMPAAEQNALVNRYCTVCHTDAAMNGGLSLQHYNAARREPTLAAMILSKLNSGAMAAAGNGVPDKAAQEAWLESTKEQAGGAKEWFVSRENGVISASIVREVPPREPGSINRPVYRVKMLCNLAIGVGEMHLTWSPQPQTGRTMVASVDGSAPVEYRIEGKESMGNGAVVQSGHASVFLSNGKEGKLELPNRSLIISELFPSETVEFDFADLDKRTRAELRRCFQARVQPSE
jgi:DNA segregation ATPase FtsK/SpoIIIE-like protein